MEELDKIKRHVREVHWPRGVHAEPDVIRVLESEQYAVSAHELKQVIEGLSPENPTQGNAQVKGVKKEMPDVPATVSVPVDAPNGAQEPAHEPAQPAAGTPRTPEDD